MRPVYTHAVKARIGHVNIIRDFLNGNGSEEKLKRLDRVGGNMLGTTLCALGDAAAMPIQSFVNKFPEEFRKYYATT